MWFMCAVSPCSAQKFSIATNLLDYANLGTLNLDEILHGLQAVGYRGAFTFECGSTLRSPRCWFGNRQSYPEDTRLLEPRCFMQDDLEKLLYHIGEYALKSYDCFED